MAWGGEISQSAHSKTQTYNLRTTAGLIGAVIFYCVPLLPWWETTEVTPATLHFSAILSGLLMLPLLYFCMRRVPDGSCYSEPVSEVDKLRELIDTARSVINNKPLLIFLAAFLFAGGGLGMWLGLLFIFVDAYLGMGTVFAQLYLVSLIVGTAGTIGWIKVATTIGRKQAWFTAMLLGIASFVYTGFLSPENSSYWALLILLVINILCFVCVESLPQSMLSDIVDYSTWKFRTYRGSTYFALFLFTYKGAFAVGGAIGLAIAGGFGFDPSATSHTKDSIVGLKMAMAGLPVLFGVPRIFRLKRT